MNKANSRQILNPDLNARDLGGLKTMDGRTVISGLLLRSANLAELTEDDQRTLQQELHLAKIIDLRTETERNERPDVNMENVQSLSVPVFNESILGISHEKSQQPTSGSAFSLNMEQLYSQMVTEESCRKNLGRAAIYVMEHDYSHGSVLWHCTEGKDRCGLLTAILLSALLVDRQTILEDYLLTNQINAPKAERYYQMMLSAGKTETEAAAVRDIFLAKESYLKKAFSAIDEQYTNTNTFLRDGLSIPLQIIKNFQKNMLR